MLFGDIPGHHELKQSLIDSFHKNHIAHAQLLKGVEGGTALALALAYSTYLFCQNKLENDSCGTCANCQKISRLVHPDIHFFYPKPSAKPGDYEKSLADSLKKWRTFVTENPFGNLDQWVRHNGFDNKNILISREDSRQMIKTVSMKSFEGEFKILIIWYPELMHPSAANAILKILEEPPTNTLYLLVTYAYENLLATITSRTQLFSIPPLQEEEITGYLTEKSGITQDQARKISRLSDGSLGKALAQVGDTDEIAYNQFRTWMLACWEGKYHDLVKLSETFGQSPKPNQRNDLEFGLSLIREALLAKSTDGAILQREGEEGKFISSFGGRISFEALEKIYFLLSESLIHLDRNANARITFMNLSLQFCELLRR